MNARKKTHLPMREPQPAVPGKPETIRERPASSAAFITLRVCPLTFVTLRINESHFTRARVWAI